MSCCFNFECLCGLVVVFEMIEFENWLNFLIKFVCDNGGIWDWVGVWLLVIIFIYIEVFKVCVIVEIMDDLFSVWMVEV